MEINLKENEFGEKRFFARGVDDEFVCKGIKVSDMGKRSECGETITEGFRCSNFGGRTFCQECQDACSMSKCLHDKFGEHSHIKFIRAKEEQDAKPELC